MFGVVQETDPHNSIFKEGFNCRSGEMQRLEDMLETEGTGGRLFLAFLVTGASFAKCSPS